MKLVVERSNLLPALALAKNRAAANATIPILKHIGLIAKEDRLTIVANDTCVMIESTIPAQVDECGSLAVPAADLYSLVRALPDGCHIQISADDVMLSLVSGRSRYRMSGLPLDQMPIMAEIEGGAEIQLTSDQVMELFDRPAVAIDAGEPRYYLQGTYVHIRDGGLRSCGTDAKNMLVCEAQIPDLGEIERSVIVPKWALPDICRLGAAGATIRWSESLFEARSGDNRLVTKVIDGTFAPYEKIVPPLTGPQAIVDRAALLGALYRLNIAESHRATLWLSSEFVELENASGDEQVSAEIEHASDFSGRIIAIPKMVAMLEALRGDTVTLYAPAGNGFVFRIVDMTQPEMICLTCTVTTK